MWQYDYFGNPVVPEYVLCKASGDRIGIIPCVEKKRHIKFNAYNEITFSTYKFMEGQKNEVYEKIKKLQHVELPEIGRFVIGNIETQSEGTDFEYKNVTALSEEVLLAQRYLELFVINCGTTGSIDGVQFYNLSDPTKSLLHLALEKCPDWTIGHVDNELHSIQRSFEIDRQDVYTCLIDNFSKAFECVFIFDTVNHIINIYAEKNVGLYTDLCLSYDNLLKSTNISASADDIKTCLVVSGAEDLNLREVNLGYDRIYNLDYFHNTEYMSNDLYDAYATWKQKWNDNVQAYTDLMFEYQKYYNEIDEAEHKRMPDDPTSENWAEYGLIPLRQKKATIDQQLQVQRNAGHGDPESEFYESNYLPLMNKLSAIEAQILVVEAEIQELKDKQAPIAEQMAAISQDVDIANNFSDQQSIELFKFIREDELSSENYVVTSIMTDSERMDMLNDMLEFGRKELAKVSQPTLSFSADLLSPFVIPEFRDLFRQAVPGNYIYIEIRDDYIVKTRMLTMEINYHDLSTLPVTFGNVMKTKGKTILSDITEALNLAQSAATSVSFNSSYWGEGSRNATEIYQMISEGLVAAGQSIHSANSDVVIDNRGIFISNMSQSVYSGDRIYIGDGKILFSDDGFQTVKTGLGRLTYTKNGTEYNAFGLMAEFVLSGYIGGSTVEGNDIIGGTITGTEFDNGNGTFKVDKDGNLIANSATITGEINADRGTIGGDKGFTIVATNTYSAIYSGSKSTFDNDSVGIYLGTNGIKLGDDFYVDASGNVTAKNGTFGNIDVKTVNGEVKTSVNANGGFSVGTSFGVSGDAKTDFDKLVVSNITAETIRATDVLAGLVDATTVKSIIGEYNFLTAGTLTVDKILPGTNTNDNIVFAGSFTATNATITGTISAGSVLSDNVELGTSNNVYLQTRENGIKITTHDDTSYLYIGASGWLGRVDGLGGSTIINLTKNNQTYIADLYSNSGRLSGTWYSTSSGSVVSDANKKNTISKISESYDPFFDNLSASTFKYNDGTSGRTHVGFISQEVKTALNDAGISSEDFAGLVIKDTVAGGQDWYLRYEEFVALNTWQIQKLKARVAELENKFNFSS